jgi:MoxR-like ATPase
MSLRSLLAPPLLGLIAAGCTTAEHYPSLLPRAAETQSSAEPVAPPPAASIADPALDARITATLRKLDASVAAFDAAAIRAARQVGAARGSPAGSEAWLDAQVALAELDGLRSATREVVTDLDVIAGERATALAPDYPALDAAIERSRAASDAQGARIAELQGMLAPA